MIFIMAKRINVMRGQSAIEYMVMIGVLFSMLTVVFIYSSQTSFLSLRATQSSEAVRIIADAADRIYKLGGGNITVTVDIPAGVVNQSVFGKAVKLSLTIGNQTGDAIAITAGNVTGSLPSAQGRYKIVVEMLSSGLVQVRPL